MLTDFPAAAPFLPDEMHAPVARGDGALGQIPLFAKLSPVEQQSLLECMKSVQFPANHPIFWYGDRGDSFYLVQTGRVAISVPSQTGQHVVLNEVGPGGFFGEISLLDGDARMATARTCEPCELLVLDQASFRKFLERRPVAAMEILAVIGQRLRKVTEALRTLENPNVAFASQRKTTWQHVTDSIAKISASPAFMIFHIVLFAGWIVVNLCATGGLLPQRIGWDPFPFGLLTMIVSLEAIMLSIMVMVSQNRQSEMDRVRTDLDFQVNVKAQTEIMAITQRLDRIEVHIAELVARCNTEQRDSHPTRR